MFQHPSLKTIAGFAAGVLSLLTLPSVQATPLAVTSSTLAFSPGTPTSAAVDAAGNVYFTNTGASNVSAEVPTPLGVLKTTAGVNYQIGSMSASVQGVAIDASGNAYVSDTANNVIKKITPAGQVTIFAGSGVAGYNDDAGLNAQFSAPAGIAVDSQGNIYVADTGNDVIRKITSAGVVSLYAGSPGVVGTANGVPTVARFTSPTGLAVDASGNLYVADTGADTIREITAGGGSVTTLAGAAGTVGHLDAFGTSATFNLPQGVAVDNQGNVYVADTGNSIIRVIAPGGQVTTIAGTALVTGTVDAAGASAQFNLPRGIAVDATGALYIADTGNGKIRKAIQSSPALGNTSPSFTLQPVSQGNFTGNTILNTVFSVLASGVPTPTYQWQCLIPTTLSNPSPTWVNLVDGVNTAGANGIGITGSTTSQLTLISTALTNANSGNQYRCVATNTVTTATSNPATLTTVSYTFAVGGVSGQVGVVGHADGTGVGATFSGPVGIVAGAGSTLYVVDTANDLLRTVSAGNVVTTIAGQVGIPGSADGSGTNITFFNPQGIATDATGALYIADAGNDVIRKITISGGTPSSTTVAGTVGVAGSINSNTSPLAAQFSNPTAVAVDSSLTMYIADTGNNTIRKVTLGGVVTTLAGSPGAGSFNDGTGSLARFNAPRGIAVDSAGNVYVADTGNNRIRRITPAGVVTTIAGSSTVGGADGIGAAATLNGPRNLSIDSSGNLYFASSGNNNVRVLTPAGAVITVASGFTAPQGVTVDSQGILSVADTGNDVIRRGFQANFAVPTISTQPSSQTTIQNANVTFTVAAAGNPSPSYQWQRQPNGTTGFSNLTDNGIYSGSATSSMTILSATTGMTGDQFQVVVTNAGGSVTSTPVSLTVNAAPTIIGQPSSQSTIPGGSVSFSVSATGTGTLTYQWYQNSVAISGATSSTLSLTNVSSANNGSYSVTVTNNGGSVLSTAAILTVGSPPTIILQPSNQSVGIGQTATFTEVDQGGTSYQWYLGNNPITGATSSTLTVPNAQTSNAGNYVVVVTNSAGTTTSNVATLTVSQVNFAGFYFGVFTGGGNWALYVNAQNQGTFLGYLPGNQSAIYVTNVSVSSTGAFSLSGASTTSTSTGLHPDASSVSYSIAGQITNNTVSSSGGTLALNGSLDSGTSESYVAGAYAAPGLLGNTGHAYAIVGGDGQALFVWVGPTSADAATGTVNGSGNLSGTTLSAGTAFSMNISGSSQFTGTFSSASFAGLSGNVSSTSRLVNLSARAVVGTGSSTLAAGFAVGGTGTKNVLLRGAGPALAVAPFNLTGTLANPVLNVYQTVNTVSTKQFTNSGWGNVPSLSALFTQLGAFAFPAFSSDTAVATSLSTGVYSEQISSANTSSGVALAEIYDADTGSSPTARLVNLSALASVGGSGLSNLSAGFVISGNAPETILIRGIGPGLTALGVSGAMPAPTLTVFNSSGGTIASNSAWGGSSTLQTTFAQVGAFSLASSSLDDAVLLTLAPGLYSAAVQPASGTGNGVALVEVYEVSH